MGYPDADLVLDINRGQVAFGDNFIEILPHSTDSTLFAGDHHPVSELVWAIEPEIINTVNERIGEPLVSEVDDRLILTEKISGVAYEITCKAPRQDAGLKSRARRVLNTSDPPAWVWAAYYAHKRLYIGATRRPDTRMKEHLGVGSDFGGANFTKIFEPTGIESLVLCTDDIAFEVEEELADFWAEEQDVFSYQA